MTTPLLFDRVWETTGTGGTGPIILNGPKTGYVSFSVVGNGNKCAYCISDGTNWEVGEGTYFTSGPTLTRDLVYSSSNNGSLVNFSAVTKDVILTDTSEFLTQINVEQSLQAAETISGARAVSINSAGQVQIAMAGMPNRMPAIGIVVDNVNTGEHPRIYNRASLDSSNLNFSGYVGQNVWVGQSGELTGVTPTNSGFIQQSLGVATSQTSLFVGATTSGGNLLVKSGNIDDYAVNNSNLNSGSVDITKLVSGLQISGLVLSGGLGSGQVAASHLASGFILPGSNVTITPGLSGYTIAATGGTTLTSGIVTSGYIGDYAVNTNNLNSGSVDITKLISGLQISGLVLSGGLGSGQVGAAHLASGFILPGSNVTITPGLGGYTIAANLSGAVTTNAQFVEPLISGSLWSLNTEELISGIRAVNISQSGYLRVAMAGVSGRMPAIGIVTTNTLSGQPANVYKIGTFQVANGLADFSGYIGLPIYVGRSGHIVTSSGSFNSGGFLSGDTLQYCGIVTNSGGFLFDIGSPLVSGLVTSGQIVDYAVNTINLNSGSVDITKLISGLQISGLVLSGGLGSGQVGAVHLASGFVLPGVGISITPGLSGYTIANLSGGALASGAVQSGMLGAYSVNTINLNSGSVDITKLTSGLQISGLVLSGGLGSGQVGVVHMASGAVIAGAGISVTRNANNFTIANLSGGTLASGAVQSGMLGAYSVNTINLNSGSVDITKLISGLQISGLVLSGGLGSGQVGTPHIYPQSVDITKLLSGLQISGLVLSGGLGSGQVGAAHLASGFILPGSNINITPGLSGYTIAANLSGATTTNAQFVEPLISGSLWSLNTEELISGIRAVSVSQSGYLRIAMASISGRMPAIGIVTTNTLSGQPATVYALGAIQATSGLADFSGYVGGPIYVGRSGHIVAGGGFLSGDTLQYCGVVTNSGGFLFDVGSPLVSGLVTSGAITSGMLGDYSVNTNNLNSGSVDITKLISGLQISGLVLSGGLGSGQVGAVHLASGFVLPGVGISITPGLSGYTIANLSGGTLASGAVQSGMLGAYSVNTINLNSGSVDITKLISGLQISGLVLSGGLGSGQVGAVHLASGFILPGTNITITPGLSGYTISATGSSVLTSGQVTSGYIGDYAVNTNNLNSGSVDITKLLSGLQISGLVLSGGLGSGQVGVVHLQSGAVIAGAGISVTRNANNFTIANLSGTAPSTTYAIYTAAELISGVTPVCWTSGSDAVRCYSNSTSGRQPAIGMVFDNVLSGQLATVYFDGPVYNTNLVNAVNFLSGSAAGTVYYAGDVIRSGNGGILYGPSSNGYPAQVVGTQINNSGFCVRIGVPLGVGDGNNEHFLGIKSLNSGGAGGLLGYQIYSKANGLVSGLVGDNAVLGHFARTPSNIAVGTIDSIDLKSGCVFGVSGLTSFVVNNSIYLGLSSGNPLTSGAVQSGMLGDYSVNTNNLNSGCVDITKLLSGLQISGLVLSGGLGSGQVAAVHMASGTVIAGVGISVTRNANNFTIANTSGGGSAVQNLLVNGNFTWMQNGTNGNFGGVSNATNDAVYLVDQWCGTAYSTSRSGQNTFGFISCAAGGTLPAAITPTMMNILRVNSLTSGFLDKAFIWQPVENWLTAELVNGQNPVTLSVYARYPLVSGASGGGTISLGLGMVECTGVADAVTSGHMISGWTTVSGSSLASGLFPKFRLNPSYVITPLTSGWQQLSVTVIPQSGATNLCPCVWTDSPMPYLAGYYLSDFQMVPQNTVTIPDPSYLSPERFFEMTFVSGTSANPDFGAALNYPADNWGTTLGALAQRNAITSTSGTCDYDWRFRVTKRATPTVTTYDWGLSGSAGNWRNTANTISWTASVSNQNPFGALVAATGLNNTAYLHATADSRL